MKVASRNEITLGKANIYCCLDGNQSKEYEIEIEKIFLNNNTDNKSMLIKVKDEELIKQTGGIIQGMSGSPVIQNGKFIRSYNKCTSKRPNPRLRSICRLNAKANVRIISK